MERINRFEPVIEADHGKLKRRMLSPGIRGEVRLVERAFGLGPSVMTEAMLQLKAAFA
jgi:transposase, IS6 family